MITSSTLIHNVSHEDLLKEISAIVQKEIEQLKQNFQPKEPEEFLTRKETSALLKIDLSTLYHHTKKGKLKAYGLGNRVYYKRSEIESRLVPLNH